MVRIEMPVEIQIAGGPGLQGALSLPDKARAIVLFAHGSGSSRFNPRNRFVARSLNRAGLGTLLLDLLSPAEGAAAVGATRSDVDLLASRLVTATDWVAHGPQTRGLRVGYFGTGSGGAAALLAAAQRPLVVGAVVSRAGRPDLAGPALTSVEAPARLLVSGDDREARRENEAALKRLRHGDLVVIAGAGEGLDEAGVLQKVANSAAAWFSRHLLAVSAEPLSDDQSPRSRGRGPVGPAVPDRVAS